MRMKDYYKVLGLASNATEEEIKTAYRTLAKRMHPDLVGDEQGSAHFHEINEAYATLSDARRRTEYDALYKKTLGRTEQPAAHAQETRARETRREETRARETRREETLRRQSARIDTKMAEKLKSAIDQSYEDGYVAGYTAAKTEATPDFQSLDTKYRAAMQENEQLRHEIKALIVAREEVDQKLTACQEQLVQKQEYADELAARLDYVKQVGFPQNDADAIPDPLDETRKDIIAHILQLKHDIEKQMDEPLSLDENIATINQQERRKQIRQELNDITLQVQKCAKELKDIKAIEDKKRAVADTDAYFREMDERAALWAKKGLSDRNKAKSTLYGVLGVLIWASDEEIRTAYNNLMTQYADQVKNEASAAYLSKLREAYDVLSVPQKRQEYNEAIGYTEKMIEKERRMAEENAKIQAQYRKKIAEKAFWSKFDELSSLALTGNPAAQNALGELYFKGAHVDRDFKNAAYWFREAFEQTYPVAIYNLGVCYQKGFGVPKNADIAEALFYQAKNYGYTAPKK